MLQHNPSSMPAWLVHTVRVHFRPDISGQSLAKGHNRSPRERAISAARWMAGSLTIRKPTASQASLLFGVCPALIRDELRRLPATTTSQSPIETTWAGMSAAERDGFVRSHLLEVWDVVDRVTAH